MGLFASIWWLAKWALKIFVFWMIIEICWAVWHKIKFKMEANARRKRANTAGGGRGFHWHGDEEPKKKKEKAKPKTKKANAPVSDDDDDGGGGGDHYEILGLERSATIEQIKSAYRQLARQYHPDKNLDDQENASKKFRSVQEAYETLSDDTKRREYDYDLRSAHSTFTQTRWQHRSHSDDEDQEHGSGICPHNPLFYVSIGQKFTRPETLDPETFLSNIEEVIVTVHLVIMLVEEGQMDVDDPNWQIIFDGIADAEPIDTRKYPSFGEPDWPWTGEEPPSPNQKKKNKKNKKGKNQNQQERKHPDAKTFYDFWLGFSAKQSFGWGGGNRKMNRAMEPVLKNVRKKYTEAVRQLARVLRDRDPRYHMAKAF